MAEDPIRPCFPVAGWRKFFVISVGDLLAATDRLGPPDTPGHASRAQPSFYVACSRFLPGTNMKTAAHLMYLHMHHHLKLGFQASPPSLTRSSADQH